MKGASYMLIYAFLFSALVTSTMQSFVESYLDDKEREVKLIASMAVKNDENACDLIQSCISTNCSRYACSRLTSELSSLSCISVPRNNDCSNSNGTCEYMKLSLKRSVIRLPMDTSVSEVEKQDDLKRSICSQRMLDNVFVQIPGNISKEGLNLTSWLYFGSATGIQRSYPGKEFSGDDCKNYDPRKRPWYISTIAVIKDLQILIDTSKSMNDRAGALTSTRSIDVAKNITLELLHTLSTNDRVQVCIFNESGAKTIQSPISIEDDNSSLSLLENVSSISVEQSYQNTSDNVFSLAMSNFKNTSNLKIIIVFSDKDIITKLNDNITRDILSQNIKLFIFRLGTDNDNDSELQAFLSKVNGSFTILGGLSNALWQIRPYFDYIAFLRLESVNNAPMWTPIFEDYSGLGKIITVTFPAFDAKNHLIGVAGVDTIVDQIEGLGSVESAIAKRKGLHPTTISGDLKYKNQDQNDACLSSSPTALCTGSGTLDFSTFSCCSECLAAQDKSKGHRLAIILGLTIGGVITFFLLGICIYYFRHMILPKFGRSNSKEWDAPL